MSLLDVRVVAAEDGAFRLLAATEEAVREPVVSGRFFSFSFPFSPSSTAGSADPFETGGALAGYVLEVELDATWEADWDRCLIATSEVFRRLSLMLLLARWPGV